MSTMFFHATARQGNLATLKELRTVSGAPMMECKKALEASDNDTEKALDWLRSKFFFSLRVEDYLFCRHF
jgi:hypothetical protein